MTHPRAAYSADRVGGLRRFAVAITVFNILGHTVFGFEESVLQVAVALGTAYGSEIILEAVDARVNGRRPRFLESWRSGVDFLLSAHISGLAIGMLLYANDRLGPMAFAAATAIASKALLRVRRLRGSVHVFNPSNFGITLTLLLFAWVGIAPPYHFTENLPAAGDAILPLIIILSGSMLNARFTHRIPLIASWLCAFVAQAAVRSAVHGTPLAAALLPMTGVAFILFTFYMITDPATTPSGLRSQIAFGTATAATYGALVSAHIVFGLFFGLTIVCAIRGAFLWVRSYAARPIVAPSYRVSPAPALAFSGPSRAPVLGSVPAPAIGSATEAQVVAEFMAGS